LRPPPTSEQIHAASPVAIESRIGRRPVAAFGNSDGDLQMLQWTTESGGRRFGLIVHHTDAVREYAYDKDSIVGHLDLALEAAKLGGRHEDRLESDFSVRAEVRAGSRGARSGRFIAAACAGATQGRRTKRKSQSPPETAPRRSRTRANDECASNLDAAPQPLGGHGDGLCSRFAPPALSGFGPKKAWCCNASRRRLTAPPVNGW
jgi:hypothetical protein